MRDTQQRPLFSGPRTVLIPLPTWWGPSLPELMSGAVGIDVDKEYINWCFRHVQSFNCVQLCYPMDCSSPGFSVHGILQARILEWVAISSSQGSSWPRDQTLISSPVFSDSLLLSHLGNPSTTSIFRYFESFMSCRGKESKLWRGHVLIINCFSPLYPSPLSPTFTHTAWPWWGWMNIYQTE